MDHSQHDINNIDDKTTIDNHSHMHHHNHGDHSIIPQVHTLDHSGHSMSNMEHMMQMAFHFGCDETILFSQWKISSTSGLIGSMIVIFLMATLYEGLKYYREHLFWKTYNLLEYRPVSMPKKGITANESNQPQAVHYVGEVIHKQPPSILSCMHFYQTFLHIIQVTLSFLLMLIFMTYNVWLCLAVVLGAAVGYFLFCWKKSVIVDVTEHCH